MDFAKLDTSKLSENGAEMVVMHPTTGEPTDTVIVLRGQDSKEYRQKVKELRQRAMKQQGGNPIDTAEEHAMQTRIACTVTWKNVELNGKSLEFSVDNALSFYGNPGLSWLVQQIDTFMRDRSNFLPQD
jgi:hypothetical protein